MDAPDRGRGGIRKKIDQALGEIAREDVVARIWALDHTVWKPDPDEIANRLGWLRAPGRMAASLPRLQELKRSALEDGFTHALLMGMGGSSLAPELFAKVLGTKNGSLDLRVLDSTDPAAVLAESNRPEPAKTLFIVSSKSGTTVEPLSFFKYFYNLQAAEVGALRAGQHFVAITDPGSRLAADAEQHGFRSLLLNDPDVGGRYSALTYFGLAPAILAGVDVAEILERAADLAVACESCVPAAHNPGARLGAILGELARAGRDKLTLITSPGLEPLADWVEQLIAESAGKEGKGIVPVVREPLGSPEVYGDDRLFVYLRLDGDSTYDVGFAALERAGHPTVRLHLRDRYDLGAQFFHWEMATAIAGYRLQINPFDQPNVEAAKALARKSIQRFVDSGDLEGPSPALSGGGLEVFGDVGDAKAPAQAVVSLLDAASPGDYFVLQAFLQPTGETTQALQALRTRVRDRWRLATMSGYGPRYLHSTGQLHKGDAGNGLFLMLTADDLEDAPIPEEAGEPGSSFTFGVLKTSQALGDMAALQEAGRRVLRIHLGNDVAAGLALLQDALA